jgi:integrase
MVNTGLRREEVAQIKWNDFYQVEIDGQLEWWLKIPQGKGDKYREVFINDNLISDIQKIDIMMRLGQSDFKVFSISGNMINKIVKKYCNVNDKNITAHKLRHTTLTHMVLKGVNSMQLKQQAGWSSIATADKYIHDIEAKQNSAGKLVDF